MELRCFGVVESAPFRVRRKKARTTNEPPVEGRFLTNATPNMGRTQKDGAQAREHVCLVLGREETTYNLCSSPTSEADPRSRTTTRAAEGFACTIAQRDRAPKRATRSHSPFPLRIPTDGKTCSKLWDRNHLANDKNSETSGGAHLHGLVGSRTRNHLRYESYRR